jgi:hypothetical protein
MGTLVFSAAASAQSASVIISNVTVSDYQGDNDGMVERGEAAVISYTVSASSSISSVTVYADDKAISTINNVGASPYSGKAMTEKLAEGNYAFRIAVNTSDGKSATFNLIYHVTRDYYGWIKVDHLWGPTQMFHTPIITGNTSTDYYNGAVADLKGTMADGNYITLTGGNSIKVPDVYMTADAGMLVNRTMECLIYLGKQNGTVPMNYSFKAGTEDSARNEVRGRGFRPAMPGKDA